jgi:hypothetical protein
LNPQTQFDRTPERGPNACTFIACVAVLRCVLRNELPEPGIWADTIMRGVRASLAAGGDCHSDLPETLPHVLPLLGLPLSALQTVRQAFRESLASLCEIPGNEGANQLDVFGSIALPRVGRAAPVEEDLKPLGVIITRPPESYALMRGRGPRIFFRDSHRLTQYDFENLEAFEAWAHLETAYFTAMPGLPHVMNEVSLFAVGSVPELLIMDALHDSSLVERPEPKASSEDNDYVILGNGSHTRSS